MPRFFSAGRKSVAAVALSDSWVAEGWVGKSMVAGKATLAPGQQNPAKTRKQCFCDKQTVLPRHRWDCSKVMNRRYFRGMQKELQSSGC